MKKIRVKLQERSYDILIGPGAIKSFPKEIKRLGIKGPVVIITDKTVESKTKKITAKPISAIPNEIIHISVPAGERSKSLDVYGDIVSKISKKTKGHKPLIVALGGGVVGDLAGFVAASYRRGVPFIQIPTTLLAQVDSSVGGKVGVDLPAAKNLIGAFYQPKVVIVDTDFLKTLSLRHVRNGMAEVIKYGIIKNRTFFKFLEDNLKDILLLKGKVLEKLIYECLRIKAQTVEIDEFDAKDVRIILNFGHTLGHAIESASEYSGLYNHGESIAIGMIMAGEIALRLDMFAESDLTRVKKLIKDTKLPVKAKGISLKDVIESHKYDKKFISGSNRFVLPKRIGSVEVVADIPPLLIRTVLKEYVG